MEETEPQGEPNWAQAGEALVRATLGLDPGTPVRVLDARAVAVDQAWVAVDAAGRYCVAGLCRIPGGPVTTARRGAGARLPVDGDGRRPPAPTCRLLYLYGTDGPLPGPDGPIRAPERVERTGR